MKYKMTIFLLLICKLIISQTNYNLIHGLDSVKQLNLRDSVLRNGFYLIQNSNQYWSRYESAVKYKTTFDIDTQIVTKRKCFLFKHTKNQIIYKLNKRIELDDTLNNFTRYIKYENELREYRVYVSPIALQKNILRVYDAKKDTNRNYIVVKFDKIDISYFQSFFADNKFSICIIQNDSITFISDEYVNEYQRNLNSDCNHICFQYQIAKNNKIYVDMLKPKSIKILK